MLRIKAPAKINIFLDAEIPARSDGFHNISSLVGKISLFDEVFLTGARGISMEVDSRWNIPRGSGNLCMKAARAIGKFAPAKGVKIKLKKRIPPGAGLGGGSSDAAAVIVGLNELWGLDLKKKEILTAASTVGSDVPLFLNQGTFCRIRGRGERVSSVRRKITGFVVLWFGQSLSTRKVYSRLDTKQREKREKRGQVLFYNVLEKAAFDLRPSLLRKKKSFFAAGARYALLSGSGSTVFGIFTLRKEAEKFCREHSSCQITGFL